MKKEYKLIKWYPAYYNLLEEGNIAIEKKNCYEVSNSNTVGMRIPKDDVENNPEFWEEIVERDYEILEIEYNGGKHNRHSRYFDMHLKDPNSRITRVKRLSDGYVFKVGDKSTLLSGRIFTISSIATYENHNTIYLYAKDGSNIDIGNAKICKPLFTTEDGVDIYEGDLDFWWIDKSDWEPKRPHDKNPFPRDTKTYKHFKSKEKAQEWIEENKPRYSKKDVIEMLEKWNKDKATEVAMKRFFQSEGWISGVESLYSEIQIIRALDKSLLFLNTGNNITIHTPTFRRNLKKIEESNEG